MAWHGVAWYGVAGPGRDCEYLMFVPTKNSRVSALRELQLTSYRNASQAFRERMSRTIAITGQIMYSPGVAK